MHAAGERRAGHAPLELRTERLQVVDVPALEAEDLGVALGLQELAQRREKIELAPGRGRPCDEVRLVGHGQHVGLPPSPKKGVIRLAGENAHTPEPSIRDRPQHNMQGRQPYPCSGHHEGAVFLCNAVQHP
eukprot:TRINITY_DN1938_c1_g1_i2.p6 TRINITY_DN1938_c1_g1~~TRINITY_DN1938_c1_g1_i2.p6  ORF type:complete len:131 (-),score=19.68 TRINITY_DN1938_c1_g1_i2:23-415(-)